MFAYKDTSPIDYTYRSSCGMNNSGDIVNVKESEIEDYTQPACVSAKIDQSSCIPLSTSTDIKTGKLKDFQKLSNYASNAHIMDHKKVEM